MSVSEILKLIENADPADTAKLDEIDARVWCYVNNEEYTKHENQDCFIDYSYPDIKQIRKLSFYLDKDDNWGYTRSRDALKAIRPKGYVFRVELHSIAMDLWSCKSEKFTDVVDSISSSYGMPTEELAELHAIIQAIQYERSNNKQPETDSPAQS